MCEEYGFHVAFAGSQALIGSHNDDDLGENAGAVYVFGGVAGFPTWSDLEGALAGTNGDPCLHGVGELTGGDAARFITVDALAGANATLVFGVAALNAPFKGGTLVPTPTLLVSDLRLWRPEVCQGCHLPVCQWWLQVACQGFHPVLHQDWRPLHVPPVPYRPNACVQSRQVQPWLLRPLQLPF